MTSIPHERSCSAETSFAGYLYLAQVCRMECRSKARKLTAPRVRPHCSHTLACPCLYLGNRGVLAQVEGLKMHGITHALPLDMLTDFSSILAFVNVKVSGLVNGMPIEDKAVIAWSSLRR